MQAPFIATRTKTKILLVQNALTMGNGTKRHLEGNGYSVVWTSSGISAHAAAEQQTVDLILIDVALPDIEGGDLCRRFRSRDATSSVPIVLLTARGQVPLPPANGGPDDYLSKPYTKAELDAKIVSALSARAAAAPPDPPPPMTQASSIVPVRGIDPKPDSGPIIVKSPAIPEQKSQELPQTIDRESSPSRTVLEQKQPEPSRGIDKGASPRSSLSSKSRHPGQVRAFGAWDNEVVDPATGLFGKKQFEAMFSKEFKRSRRFKQHMSCMLIDLDGRRIGREGDAATLRAIIRLVQCTIREVDTAAWWTGEAFIVLLPNTMRYDAVQAAARVLESVANHPFSWSDSSKVTLSIGVAGMPDFKIETEKKLIEAATAACKRAGDLMLPRPRSER